MKTNFDVTTTRTPPAACPCCGAKLNAVTGERTPEPGDFTICLQCAELLRFDADLRQRKLSQRELIDVQTSQLWPKLQFVQRKIRQFRSQPQGPPAKPESGWPSLGACCNCGVEGPRVSNVLMLPFKSPVTGVGCWGCLQCGLPQEGAVAVLCDSCFEKSGGWPDNACLGSPADNRRIPIKELIEPFEHDPRKHPAEGWIQ